MALYVDAPRWAAHGTHFAHLVSDGDLAELHAAALALGLPARAFDLDHYDLPAARRQAALAAGAEAVDRRTLLRVLEDAGLRVRGRDRSAARRAVTLSLLRDRWRRLGRRLDVASDATDPAPAHPAPAGRWDAAWVDVGEDLLGRWDEPHRHYHDRTHLFEVLVRLDLLTGELPDPRAEPTPVAERPRTPTDGGVPTATLLAAWFHDAIHTGHEGADEAASAELARTALAGVGVSPAVAERVARLVARTDHLTGASSRAGDTDEAGGAGENAETALLLDADLGILAAAPRRYRAYTAAVRREYPELSDAQFARGRASAVRTLLGTDPLFRTPAGYARWEDAARHNLRAELTALEPATEPS